jgi:hypothetical protein
MVQQRFNHRIWDHLDGVLILSDAQTVMVCTLPQTNNFLRPAIVIGMVDAVRVREDNNPLIYRDDYLALSSIGIRGHVAEKASALAAGFQQRHRTAWIFRKPRRQRRSGRAAVATVYDEIRDQSFPSRKALVPLAGFSKRVL